MSPAVGLLWLFLAGVALYIAHIQPDCDPDADQPDW